MIPTSVHVHIVHHCLLSHPLEVSTAGALIGVVTLRAMSTACSPSRRHSTKDKRPRIVLVARVPTI